METHRQKSFRFPSSKRPVSKNLARYEPTSSQNVPKSTAPYNAYLPERNIQKIRPDCQHFFAQNNNHAGAELKINLFSDLK